MTLRSLQRETVQLQRKLQLLVDRYPEGGLEPDDRILNRLLTTYWRQAHGGLPGPRERRYWEAVDWVNQFHAYIRRLSDYFRYEAEEPERLGKLPLAIALPLPAAELIRRLSLQGQMLKRWAGSGKEPDPRRGKDEREIRTYLRSQCNVKGLEVVAREIGCDRDTLSDFLNESTKPQEKTLQKFREYRQLQQALPAKQDRGSERRPR